MERLTIPDVRVDEHTTRRSVIDVLAVREHAMEIYHRLKVYEDFAELCDGADRLRELAEADKKGRCVVLPCDVGDELWSTQTWYSIPKEPQRLEVREIIVRPGGFVIVTNKRRFEAEKIGKTVFLSREVAEKAIRGRQEQGGKTWID